MNDLFFLRSPKITKVLMKTKYDIDYKSTMLIDYLISHFTKTLPPTAPSSTSPICTGPTPCGVPV